MDKVNIDNLFLAAISKWGERNQIEMLQGEATELALATRKFIRGGGIVAEHNLISEVADVEIMIGQLSHLISNFRGKVNEEKEYKLKRLYDRVYDEEVN